ncbi:MAG: protein kinase [Kofleriaceae bacterium]|nr:protein kinase [Kofleriaceae bacterium]
MGLSRTYLAAFTTLGEIADADERRRVARQGLAMIAHLAEHEPAPLEGLGADNLLRAVRIAVEDGVLADLDWLSPAAGAIALFELAQALPPGTERRELGRRVLTRLRAADRETFVRLVIALARSSPKLLASDALRARTEVVLAAPLIAPGATGELALALLAQPALAASWIEGPAMGSLPGRRLVARTLAHGAREAVRRYDAGDRGGAQVLARPALRAALLRLVNDREALVWRFACIARGLLAHVDTDLAADIDRELRPTASATDLRRGCASAAAALERGGAAQRWESMIVDRTAKDPGGARGAILGLAGLAIRAPEAADSLACKLIERAPLDGAEALAELRREEASPLLPMAAQRALAWTRARLGDPETVDDGRIALLQVLEQELGDGPRPAAVIELGPARAALDAGDVPGALREVRTAVEEIAAAADWLERATDDDPLDRRHSMRLLRELDRELLSDNTLAAVLALAAENDPSRGHLAKALAALEAALLAREARPEPGPVAHGGLRIARLRALVRLLDGVRAIGDADLAPRLAAVRLLMARAADDQSQLRRAVWAALTRAGDALLRDDHVELTDLLFAWTTAFPDEDFAIVREASMIPEVGATFESYTRLMQATWAAADPDDIEAMRAVVERIAELADAFPPEQSPRVESVRLAVVRLANQLAKVTASASLEAIPAGTFDAIADELGALARRNFGAHQRLGLRHPDGSAELEAAVRAIEVALRTNPGGLEEAIAGVLDALRTGLPTVIAAAIERVLLWLARRPLGRSADEDTPSPVETALPPWVPLSRLVGSFYIVRPIGRGAGGSVMLASRAEERARADRELLALKVPDYSGGAARNMSILQFEAMFRDEAGALLALPSHPNLAGFVTFDASAQPKPILVMEYVRGMNLERALELRALDTQRAFAIIDGLLAGLEAMHRVNIAHLDVKPANVVLREGTGVAVLVDFGLAGRRIRTGCGSMHYGAREVWIENPTEEPFAADVYAAACVAFEVLTDTVLVRGETMREILDNHLSLQPANAVLTQLARKPHLASLAELLRVAVARDSKRRPTAARLRAGFAAIAPDLHNLAWPIRT